MKLYIIRYGVQGNPENCQQPRTQTEFIEAETREEALSLSCEEYMTEGYTISEATAAEAFDYFTALENIDDEIPFM